MFYAADPLGRLRSLFHLTRKEIMTIKDQAFYCPTCQERLQIRFGPKVTPHFAHYPKSDCSILTSGETVEHETGKWMLYQWLLNQGYAVEIECYLSDIQQRPDLLLTVGTKKVAIEYQCATIPIKVVEKRSHAYKTNGIFPLWILGMNQLHNHGKHSLTFTEFLRSFLYYFNSHFQMFFLNPSTGQLTVATHMRNTGHRQVSAYLQTSSLSTLTFPQLFTFSNQHFSYSVRQEWEKLLYTHRTKYRKHVSTDERNLRQYLYLKGHHFSMIPTIGYLPLPGQMTSLQKPYVWQSRWLLDHFINVPIGSPVVIPSIPHQQTVNGYQPDLSHEYLSVMAGLDYVKQAGNNKWIKKKEVTFHRRMEDALKDDQQTIKNLQRISFQGGFYS